MRLPRGAARRAAALLPLLAAGAGAVEIAGSAAWEAALGQGKPVFAKMYAPWCGHCKRMKPAWDALVATADRMGGSDGGSGVVIADVDCIGAGKDVCAKAGVKGFPALLYYKDDAATFPERWRTAPASLGQKYTGGRDAKSLEQFVRDTLAPARPPAGGAQQAEQAARAADAPGGGAARGEAADVVCESSAGGFTIHLHKEWAPLGYERFVALVRAHFFTDQVVYRVIPKFVAQFGVAADPEVHKAWAERFIDDDPPFPGLKFQRGHVSFAGHGPNSRSTHVFVADSPRGERLGKAHHERPFGIITAGLDSFLSGTYSDYGDLTSLQLDLVRDGNAAAEKYPLLTRVQRCWVDGEKDLPAVLPGRKLGEGAAEKPRAQDGSGKLPPQGAVTPPPDVLAAASQQQQLKDLQAQKAAAMAADDLELALSLKKKIQAVEKETSSGVAGLRARLAAVVAEKAKALGADDLETALKLKKEAKALEAEIAKAG